MTDPTRSDPARSTHPLARLAAAMPRLESTSAAPEEIDATVLLVRLRSLLDEHMVKAAVGDATPQDWLLLAEALQYVRRACLAQVPPVPGE